MSGEGKMYDQMKREREIHPEWFIQPFEGATVERKNGKTRIHLNEKYVQLYGNPKTGSKTDFYIEEKNEFEKYRDEQMEKSKKHDYMPELSRQVKRMINPKPFCGAGNPVTCRRCGLSNDSNGSWCYYCLNVIV